MEREKREGRVRNRSWYSSYMKHTHSFTMETKLTDFKGRRKDVRLVWLDLKNAFGSVPHELMWYMMQKMQIPQPFIDLCQEIYQGSTQRVRTKEGYTNDIPVKVGIKQGCPLSPLLFNLALEAVLPALKNRPGSYKLQNGSAIDQLAYADDLCLIGRKWRHS